jgi:hypothetical protein
MDMLWIPTLRIETRLTLWGRHLPLVTIMTEALDLRVIDTPSVNCLFEIVREDLSACGVSIPIPNKGVWGGRIVLDVC